MGLWEVLKFRQDPSVLDSFVEGNIKGREMQTTPNKNL